MTAMTSVSLGLILIVFSVLVLVWGFPNLPKR
jgi:Sec-independent protein translocase protein TatA